jgi:hypothetical protein
LIAADTVIELPAQVHPSGSIHYTSIGTRLRTHLRVRRCEAAGAGSQTHTTIYVSSRSSEYNVAAAFDICLPTVVGSKENQPRRRQVAYSVH